MTGIEFPVTIKKIFKFEKQNTSISINVFGLHEKNVIPFYLTHEKKENHINLLLLEKKIKGQLKSHYVHIKNLSRLVAGSLSHRKKKRYIWECPAETGHRARALPFSRKRRSV